MNTEVCKKIWITNGDGDIEIHTAKPDYDKYLKCWYSESLHTIQGVYDEPEYSHEFTIDELRGIDALPKEGEMIECEIILRRSVWHKSLEEVPDNARDILVMWDDNGITQSFYENGKFHDGDYSCEPCDGVLWMEIPQV